MKRVLVTGAQGMLGMDVVREFEGDFDVSGLSRAQLDITDRRAVRETVQALRPHVVVNCAAFTNVDECEARPDPAFKINAEGPEILAGACRDRDAFLVHVSTDYVFDGSGSRPYTEDDPVGPLNIYGKSKLEGELRIQKMAGRYLIIRTSWLFGLNGPNFIKTMLCLAGNRKELSVVDDQKGSPTFTRDLAWAIKSLVALSAEGICHCSNRGWCTWFGLCRFVFEQSGISDVRLEPIPTSRFPRPARRPAFSVLDNMRFHELAGRQMRPWQEAVSEYLRILEHEGIDERAV